MEDEEVSDSFISFIKDYKFQARDLCRRLKWKLRDNKRKLLRKMGRETY